MKGKKGKEGREEYLNIEGKERLLMLTKVKRGEKKVSFLTIRGESLWRAFSGKGKGRKLFRGGGKKSCLVISKKKGGGEGGG